MDEIVEAAQHGDREAALWVLERFLHGASDPETVAFAHEILVRVIRGETPLPRPTHRPTPSRNGALAVSSAALRVAVARRKDEGRSEAQAITEIAEEWKLSEDTIRRVLKGGVLSPTLAAKADKVIRAETLRELERLAEDRRKK